MKKDYVKPIRCSDGTEFCKASYSDDANAIVLRTRGKEILYRDVKRQIGEANFMTRKKPK